MTIGTLRVALSQPFDNVLGDVKKVSSLLGLSPVAPSFGKILAWSSEGDEVELEGWPREQLMENKIQLMNFWNVHEADLMVSWQLVND